MCILSLSMAIASATATSPSSPPSAPPVPPLPPAPPIAPGFILATTVAALRSVIAGAAPGSTLSVALPPGATFLIGGDPIVLDNVALHLTSSGRGAVLDGAHRSRCIEVRNSAQVHLTEISLRNGRAVDAPGGCALVNGSGSELTLDGGGVVDCEALWDAFVPDRVTIHGGPYGKFAEAGGGGVAAIHGARFAADSTRFERCHADIYGGGVLAYDGADVVLHGSEMHECTAAMGGGVASFLVGTQALVRDTTIVGSSHPRSVGAGLSRQCGGVGVAYGAEADVVDSIVAGMNHSSFFGGGAFCSHAGAGNPTYKAPLTVTRTTVRDSGAGALIIIGLGPVAIKDSHFLRCSGHYGAFWAINRANLTMVDTVMEGCTGAEGGAGTQMSGSFYGRNLTVRDCHAVGGSSNGAGGLTFRGFGRSVVNAVLEDSTIESCTNAGAGGLSATNAAVVLRRAMVRDCHSEARGGGGVRVGTDGSVTAVATTISRCTAAPITGWTTDGPPSEGGGGGGVLVATGGALALRERSVVANCTASYGGLLAVIGGIATVEDSELLRGKTYRVTNLGMPPASGGCIYAAADVSVVPPVGATLTLTRSAVHECIAGEADEANASAILSGPPCVRENGDLFSAWRWPELGNGGGLVVGGAATVVRLVASEVRGCVALRNAGAYVVAGTLRLEQGTTIERCTACETAGGVGVGDGHLQAVGAVFRECSAHTHGGGGLLLSSAGLVRGEITLDDTVFSRCTAPVGNGAAIRGGNQRLTARNLTIRECGGSNDKDSGMKLAGTAHVTALTLTPPCLPLGDAPPVLVDERDDTHRYKVGHLRIEPADGCTLHADTDALMTAALGDVSAWEASSYGCDDVDACGAHAACSDVAVADGAPLTSPTCACAPPNVWPTAAGDVGAALLPYSAGCLTPRYGARVDVANLVAASVVLRLTKPENASRVLRLHTGGSAAAAVKWSIDRPSSLRSWLAVDTVSGSVDAPEETSQAILTLTASSSGLAEQSEPHQWTIRLVAESMLTTTFEVPVLLFVSAEADATTSRWGDQAGDDCTTMAGGAADVAVTLGTKARVPFTACDIDAMPVAHALPARFSATLVDDTSVEVAGGATVQYVGGGVHEVLVSPPRVGVYTLTLTLDGVAVDGARRVDVSCSNNTVALDGGAACGCAAGYEPAGADGACTPCAEQYVKESAGNALCAKEEAAVWPIIAATAGAVLGGVLLLLCGYGGRQQWRRYRRAMEATAAALDARRDRCKRAVNAMQELRHSFCLLRFVDLRELGEFVRHESALERGKLRHLHTMREAAAFSAAHPVVFCSHQWLAFAHPDPAGVQHATLVAACEKLCAEQGFAEGDLYVWLDYSCVPQSNRAMQLAAISSLHAYAACSKYFVAVVPPTAHCDTDAACDGGSYAGRGWCRLEQMAYVLVHGTTHAYSHDSTELHRLATRQGWLASALDVFGANFSQAGDRLVLVDVLLGLYGFAILGQGSEGGQPAAGRTADVENTVGPADLWGLIETQKSTVFPAAYFADLVALLEKGLETTIKNDKGGGEKGGEKGGGGGEPALFSAEELARLLQARQDFLAIQGRTLRPELTKHLEERKLQVLGQARLPADGSTMHGVQAVPEQLLSA